MRPHLPEAMSWRIPHGPNRNAHQVFTHTPVAFHSIGQSAVATMPGWLGGAYVTGLVPVVSQSMPDFGSHVTTTW
jgi:hypothetical protein